MQVLTRVEVAERMTSAEFFRYAPEDKKAELIDGVLIVPSPATDKHERLVLFLLRVLAEFVERKNLGLVRGSRTPVRLEEEQIFEPDVLFVSRERAQIVQEKGVFGAPDFVIEILSASTVGYDRGHKFRVYERTGVNELWLIDPYGPAGTEFYQRQAQRLAAVMPDQNGILKSVAVPDFEIQTRWLWPTEHFIAVRDALRQMNVS